jgi:hypothetical protein
MMVFLPPPPELAGQPPRCVRCAYILEQLEEARCPECGSAFAPWDLSTYTFKPPFHFWRFWAPGAVLAVVGVIGVMAALPSFPLWLRLFGGSDFAAGAILGYGFRDRTRAVTLAALTGVETLFFRLLARTADDFILVTVMTIAAVVVGGAGGAALRDELKKRAFGQKSHLPATSK